MSYNSIPICFLIVALVYAGAAPFADATFARSVTITGRFCCAGNGNCLAGSVGVAGVPVTLRCPGLFPPIYTVVATATTDVAGNFVLTSGVQPAPIVPALCVVNAQLPLTGAAAVSCPLLGGTTPARTLTALVSITSSGLFTGVATGVALPFF